MEFAATNAWKEAVLNRVIYTNIPDAADSPAHDTVLYVGEQVVLDTLRRKYRNLPRQYVPLPNGLVAVQSTPSLSLGVFAKRAFKPGDVVVRERPFLVAAADIGFDPSAGGKKVNPLIGNSVLGEILKSAERHFLPPNRDGFAALLTDYSLNPVHDLMKDMFRSLYVLCCNSFRIGEKDLETSGVYKDYRLVSRVASRINHSCSPNVVCHFDEATFTFNAVVTRKIRIGEEILTTYCALELPRAERHRYLLPYNIDPCRCEACEMTDQEGSNQRRKMIYDYDMHKVIQLSPRKALKELIGVRNAIEEENLQFLPVYGMVLQLMSSFWAKLGKSTLSEGLQKQADLYHSIHTSGPSR
ncbi:hypothetical protein GGU10DRAFT_16529 [Lentinula aff. detonsa]|uniref:SET domain-containing protein n=1 Tax=Lentinula aff. detonsa TaxID=2804958 RepID=A0AA38U0J7_9AGAR|nr:hypothetical protein GGU10DRAFT_16529 [Lentinula aff. detonsa]